MTSATRAAIVRSVIDSWTTRPFKYGEDCCQFAGDVVLALTGTNPMTAFAYHDEAGALAIIARFGSLENAMFETLGDPYTGEPMDGDVTIHDLADGTQVAGIVYQGRSVVRTKRSVTDWPLHWVKTIWRVL